MFALSNIVLITILIVLLIQHYKNRGFLFYKRFYSTTNIAHKTHLCLPSCHRFKDKYMKEDSKKIGG